MSSKLCFYLLKPRSLCSILSGHFCQELGQHLLHFFLSHRPCETGWDLGPLAEVLAPRQMSPQAIKYKETMHAYMLSPQSCSALWDPVYCSLPGLLSLGFSRQEYWNGLPCPLPGDLPNPWIESPSPMSPAFEPHLLCLLHCKQEGPWNWFLLFCVFYLFIF